MKKLKVLLKYINNLLTKIITNNKIIIKFDQKMTFC